MLSWDEYNEEQTTPSAQAMPVQPTAPIEAEPALAEAVLEPAPEPIPAGVRYGLT